MILRYILSVTEKNIRIQLLSNSTIHAMQPLSNMQIPTCDVTPKTSRKKPAIFRSLRYVYYNNF